MKQGEVRLDPGTKNGEGRMFPITRELRRVLEAQQQVAAALRARGTIVRYVFCFTEGRRRGSASPRVATTTPGAKPGSRRGVRDASHMTSGARGPQFCARRGAGTRGHADERAQDTGGL